MTDIDASRYDTHKSNGKPRTCKFCGQPIWWDRHQLAYVNASDQLKHSCDRKQSHFHSEAMVNAETRRHHRIR
jgi:hypothetical protein